MYINVLEFKEEPDGSAILDVVMDEEMKTFLIQKGLESLLLEKAKEVIESA